MTKTEKYLAAAILDADAGRRLIELKAAAWKVLDAPCETARDDALDELADLIGYTCGRE